jgi:hypothetical protein
VASCRTKRRRRATGTGRCRGTLHDGDHLKRQSRLGNILPSAPARVHGGRLSVIATALAQAPFALATHDGVLLEALLATRPGTVELNRPGFSGDSVWWDRPQAEGRC